MSLEKKGNKIMKKVSNKNAKKKHKTMAKKIKITKLW